MRRGFWEGGRHSRGQWDSQSLAWPGVGGGWLDAYSWAVSSKVVLTGLLSAALSLEKVQAPGLPMTLVSLSGD